MPFKFPIDMSKTQQLFSAILFSGCPSSTTVSHRHQTLFHAQLVSYLVSLVSAIAHTL